MRDELLLRYGRHVMLDGFGEVGQQRLSEARVVVVGLGGLGAPAAMYLAAAGVGELVLCDDDEVEASNLQRQIVFDEDALGQVKTAAGAVRLRALNRYCTVRVFGRVTADNAQALVAGADVVVDGCDNFAGRHVVNRACVAARVPLASGAVLGFDGQVAVFDVREAASPCYNCLFSESDAAEDARCALLGVLAPLAGVVGSVLAVEAIRLVVGFGRGLVGRLVLVDGRDMRFREVAVPRDARCAVCHAR